MNQRIDTLLEKLNKQQIDSMLVTSKENVFYYSHYNTDPHERVIGIYMTSAHDPILIVPNMEVNDAKDAGWTDHILGYDDHEDVWALLLALLQDLGHLPNKLGLEYDHLTLERFYAIKRIMPDAEMVDVQETLASLRVIKDSEEYKILKEAAALADFGIQTGMEAITAGVTELEVIATIEYELKKRGVEAMSFSTMVLFGDNATSPHGTPGLNEIQPGDLVLFDLGVMYKGYASDMTRTFSYKSITEEQAKIYETVLEAEEKAIEAAQLGTEVGHLDSVARDHITEAGYGEHFPHRIGHGIGIDVHEYPSMHANNTLELEPGMCFTIEPGIYIPGTAGVRIEDMVIMTDEGPEVLTQFPKNLQVIHADD